jgi:hypothetical protein
LLSCFLTFSLSHFLTFVYSAPYHTIKIDGNLSEWSEDELLVDDTNDSVWDPGTGKNEIQKLYCTWDADSLYIGILGKTDYGLLIYLDIDSRNAFGVSELLEVPTWNRKVMFKNYYPDFFYGSWNGSTGNLYRIESSTRVTDVSGYTELSADKSSAMPGYELKIPFDLLYGLGSGKVPPGVTLSIFASLATGDVEDSYGYLGGDTVPDNTICVLNVSTITSFISINIDTDNDGKPDDSFETKTFEISDEHISRKVFSPYGIYKDTRLTANLTRPANITVKIFNLKGDLVYTLASNDYNSKVDYTWDGKDKKGEVVPAGLYIINLSADSGSGKTIRRNYSVAVIK